MRRTFAGVAAVILAASADESSPSLSPVPDRNAVLGEMARIISATIERNDTRNPVFHGSLDWHSAVHGHWALLRIARATRAHKEEAEKADRALSVEGIAKEAETLRDYPAFEMPYGRSWFLRLAIEHELWSRENGGKDPLRLRGMADEAAKSLLAHFREFPPSPCSGEYASASWAFAQLRDYFRHTKAAAELAQVDEQIRKRFLDTPVRLDFGADAGCPEFFSLAGNWAYLVTRIEDPETLKAFLEKNPIPDSSLAPVSKLLPSPHGIKAPLPESHQLGMNWSRAWALRALSRAAVRKEDRERFDRAFLEHVKTALEHHAKYAGDFKLYDHWIPQFAVYALTESEVR